MASIRDAIEAYRPELQLHEPVELDESVEFLSEKTGVEADTLRSVLEGFRELAYWFLVRGKPVPLPGVGHLLPRIALNGKIYVSVDTDEEFMERLSAPDAYRAEINRRENVGVDLARLAQMWNSSHPDDPIRDLDAFAVKSG